MDEFSTIKDDFDLIAKTEGAAKWDHNSFYFRYLLKFLPERLDKCLDIGCGTGNLSRLLSERAESVIAVDLSDEMIKRAKNLNAEKSISYICANIYDLELENHSLDLIITTATAHHLDFEWLLEFAKKKLKSGGRLIILDLVKAETLFDTLLWSFAVLPNIFMRKIKTGSFREDKNAREAWKKHSLHDKYMTVSEIKTLAKKHLGDAFVKRKLFWRYVLVWEA